MGIDHEDYLPGEAPAPHKLTHQDGGGDEINVTGLEGLYTDAKAVDAMGVLGDGNPLNHDRAAEWGAAEHTAIGDAAPHHVKYTDGEAVTAMGVLGDGNPLNHDRAAAWGAAEHTAIGDGAPHHVKYTDGQAGAVAQIVWNGNFAIAAVLGTL